MSHYAAERAGNPRRKGTIDPAMRQRLHCRLDRLIDQRNLFERACTDLGYRRFKPVDHLRTSAKVPESAVEALIAHEAGLRFIADVIGDEIIELLNADRNLDETRTSVPGLWRLLAGLAPILPYTRHPIEKHRLVALLWQERMIRDGCNRKGPKSIVGEAYDLEKDAVSKWEAGCRRKLGRFFDEAVGAAAAIQPEDFFDLVFGRRDGPKDLRQCAEAYQLELGRLKKGARRGRPRKSG